MRKNRRPASCPARALLFEGKRFEQGSLLFWSEVDETLSGRLLAVCVQPRQASAEAILRVRIACDHEVDEFGDARLLRARCAIARNDEVGEPLDHRVFCRREKLWMIGSWV